MSSASEQCWNAAIATNFDTTHNTMSLAMPQFKFAPGNWTEQLTLETPWWQPDQNMGQHFFTCSYYGQPYQWAYFGSQAAGGKTYHFSFVNSSYWNQIDLGVNAQGYMGFLG